MILAIGYWGILMKRTEAEIILAEAGLSDEAITATLAGIRDLHGKFACRSPRELWIEDTTTGALRFPAEVGAHYRQRFARAGLALDQHLSGKQAFLQAYRIVLDAEREALYQEDAARVVGMKPGDPRVGIARAFREGDLPEIKRQFRFLSRRSTLKSV